MTIQTGDQIPSIDLSIMSDEGPTTVNTHDLCLNKKVVLFAVPGAFTPGCSKTHLPGFVVNADNIKAKGFDSIICTSVNDVFVMAAWGQAQNAEAIIMAADGNGELAKALGLDKDASVWGMGLRSQRYGMIIDNGQVTYLGIDSKAIEASAAEAILAHL
jgi:peroxiredoxin